MNDEEYIVFVVAFRSVCRKVIQQLNIQYIDSKNMAGIQTRRTNAKAQMIFSF